MEYIEILKKYPRLELFTAENLDADLLSVNEKERGTYAWLGLTTSLNDAKKDQAQKEAESALANAEDAAEKEDALFVG